jgi:hypothetical protein
MAFEPLTMVPSGIRIAGWNNATFEPPTGIDPVENEIIEPSFVNWDAFPVISGAGFLLFSSLANVFILEEIPETAAVIDDDGTPECAWGSTFILGGLVLPECGWPESVIRGGIIMGECGATFNEGVFPPPEPPPPVPPERCPADAACDIVPDLSFLQEVAE